MGDLSVEAKDFSDTSVHSHHRPWHHIPEDCNFNSRKFLHVNTCKTLQPVVIQLIMLHVVGPVQSPGGSALVKDTPVPFLSLALSFTLSYVMIYCFVSFNRV